ncbi:hypothetical protein BDQ17DRAFT_1430404 [Cyathus striatus]|nr:hypothetical protein BDQ17DRAFT_1430404 [Cyathus striatus]
MSLDNAQRKMQWPPVAEVLLETLAENSENIDTLDLRMIHHRVTIESEDEDESHSSTHEISSDSTDDIHEISPKEEHLVNLIVELQSSRKGLVGDTWSHYITHQLVRGAPYPGDSKTEPDESLRNRFSMYLSGSGNYYAIVDSERLFLDEPILHTLWIREPDFDITHWYTIEYAMCENLVIPMKPKMTDKQSDDFNIFAWNAKHILSICGPYPGEYLLGSISEIWRRFSIKLTDVFTDTYTIYDNELTFKIDIQGKHLRNRKFNLANWYSRQLEKTYNNLLSEIFSLEAKDVLTSLLDPPSEVEAAIIDIYNEIGDIISINNKVKFLEMSNYHLVVELNGQQVEPAIKINGHPVHALVDSGSLGDFMSTKLADQLKGSRTKSNYGTQNALALPAPSVLWFTPAKHHNWKQQVTPYQGTAYHAVGVAST